MTDTAAPSNNSTDSADLLDLVTEINAMNPSTLVTRMGIVFTEAHKGRFVATMPVEGNTQPYGLLHGGASVVLAETLDLGGRRTAKVVVRKDLATGALLSQAVLGPGVRSADPGVAEQVSDGLRRVREQVGLD